MREVLGLALIIGLPLLSWPLAWLPSPWAQFRFSLMLPIAPAVLMFVLILGAQEAHKGDIELCQTALLWPLVCVAASALVSVRFSQRPDVSIGTLVAVMSNVAVFLLAARIPAERLPTLCGCWVGTAAIVAINGLVRCGSEGEFISTIGNRNFLAAYLAASVLICAGTLSKRSAIAIVVMIAALFFCRSRGAWLALAYAGLACVWVNEVRPDPHLRAQWVQWTVGVVLVGVTLVIFFAGQIGRLWQQDVRPMIWKGTVQMIAAHPLVGHGVGTFAIEYPRYRVPEYFQRPKAANATDHAHNELLETFTEQGMVGLFALVWLWAAAIFSGMCALWKSPNQNKLRLGLVGASVAFILHSMVDVDLRLPPNQTLLWMLLGLLAGTAQEQPVRISLRSKTARTIIALPLVIAAGWVAVGSVIAPVRADYWERRARLAEARGDFQTAATDGARALTSQPLRLTTRYFYAGVLARIPDPQARAQAIDECLRIENDAPDYGDITFNLGQLYIAENRPADALPYLSRAVRLNPYSADKRYALGLALNQLGQRTAAVEQLQEALRLNPDHADARQLLLRMGQDIGP